MALRRRLVLLATTLAVLAALPGGAAAGPGRAGLGGDFRISGPGALDKDWAPAIAFNDTDHEYLVVWSDLRRQVTRGADIYLRRIGADGSLHGKEVRLSPAGTADDESPAVAYNPAANQYLVAWAREWSIYGQIVAADGTKAGPAFLIQGPGAISDCHSPAVAYNSDADEYLVVWTDWRDFATRREDIYGRRVAADGTPVGADSRIGGAEAAARDTQPAVAYNPDRGEYFVVWQDGRSYNDRKEDIYGRRVAADGTPRGKDRRISGPRATAEEWFPAVAYNPASGQYLVVWQDWRKAATRGWDVYGRRLAGTGAPAAPDFRISGLGARADDVHPSLALNSGDDSYLVVWADWRLGAARGADVFGKALPATGAAIGSDFRISGPKATADENWPVAAYNAEADEFLVVWEDYRNEATRNVDVFARRLAG